METHKEGEVVLEEGRQNTRVLLKKSSVDRNKPIKGLWTNLEQFAKMF